MFARSGDWRILVNSASCTNCDSVLESVTVDDIQVCGCGKIAIYGGLTTLGRTGDIGSFNEMSRIAIRRYE